MVLASTRHPYRDGVSIVLPREAPSRPKNGNLAGTETSGMTLGVFRLSFFMLYHLNCGLNSKPVSIPHQLVDAELCNFPVHKFAGFLNATFVLTCTLLKRSCQFVVLV